MARWSATTPAAFTEWGVDPRASPAGRSEARTRANRNPDPRKLTEDARELRNQRGHQRPAPQRHDDHRDDPDDGHLGRTDGWGSAGGPPDRQDAADLPGSGRGRRLPHR